VRKVQGNHKVSALKLYKSNSCFPMSSRIMHPGTFAAREN